MCNKSNTILKVVIDVSNINGDGCCCFFLFKDQHSTIVQNPTSQLVKSSEKNEMRAKQHN